MDTNKQPNASQPSYLETIRNLLPGQARLRTEQDPQQDDNKHPNDDPATTPFGHMSVSSYGAHEPEDKEVKNLNFSDENIRKGFVRRAYSILMCQFLIGLGAICLFLYQPLTARWAQGHREVFLYAFGVWAIMMITMFCFDTAIRKFPANVIFLFILTLVDSFVLATAASSFNLEELVMVVSVMVAVCFFLILFTFQPRYVFSFTNGFLYITLLIAISFGIIGTVFFSANKLALIFGSIGTFIFSLYLICIALLMIEGDHMYIFSPDEYIFASFNFYMDVLRILCYIVKNVDD